MIEIDNLSADDLSKKKYEPLTVPSLRDLQYSLGLVAAIAYCVPKYRNTFMH